MALAVTASHYPGIELASPALAGGFFTTESPGKPTIISESIHGAANGIILLFFMAEDYSTVSTCHIFSIHSSVDVHLACFHVLDIVNSVGMLFLILSLSFFEKLKARLLGIPTVIILDVSGQRIAGHLWYETKGGDFHTE